MRNNHKIILIKTLLILSLILMFVTFFSLYKLEIQIANTDQYYFYEKIAAIMCFIFVSTTFITVFLMTKINITAEKTKSDKHKIKYDNFGDFKDYLYIALEENNYNIFDTYENNLYKLDYVIRKIRKEINIIVILKIDELSEELYNNYKNTHFEEFGNYLLDNNYINVTDNFNITYIICVDRVNKYFSNYTESNVKQYFGRYTLSVGVSFASKTLYIATQKDGFAKGKWNKLKKEFMKYINDIIVNDNILKD